MPICPTCKNPLGTKDYSFKRTATEKEIETITPFLGKKYGHVIINLEGDQFIIKVNLFFCENCQKALCCNLESHKKSSEMNEKEDKRGKYLACSYCKWYPYIEIENILSAEAEKQVEQMFKQEMIKQGADPKKIRFEGSALNAQKEWLTYGDRKKTYGNAQEADLDIIIGDERLSKIEIKRWGSNWNTIAFFKSVANINRREVEDACKLDGFIAFYIEKDNYVHLLDAKKVYSAYTSKQTDFITAGTDKQANFRWKVTVAGKKALSISLQDAVKKVLAKVK